MDQTIDTTTASAHTDEGHDDSFLFYVINLYLDGKVTASDAARVVNSWKEGRP